MLNVNSRFTFNPSVNIGRSKFRRDQDHKFTMSAGLAYPIFVDEYIPGDTFSLNTRAFVRMSTPIHPVMDNCYLDIYYFSVPYRLVWDHWKEFMGEPSDDPFAEPVEYTIPRLSTPIFDGHEKAIYFKSVADYMGIPPSTSTAQGGVSALPFRAYALIWNEWFRSEQLFNAIEFSTGDEDDDMYSYITSGASAEDDFVLHYTSSDSSFSPEAYVSTAAYGGYLAPVAKFHDYFTSALPDAQFGDPVPIPLSGYVPVLPIDRTFPSSMGSGEPLLMSNVGPYSGEGGMHIGIVPGTSYYGSDVDQYSGLAYPSNLAADLTKIFTLYGNSPANINDLRYAFQMQKYLEADNRYGRRYIETIYGHFGVTSPDGRIQRPELLGGKRIRINMSQVLQTSSSDSTSPQGNTAAYSATLDVSDSFTKSFTEHGLIIGIACIRPQHTYQQGTERFWLRKDKFDFYFPEFANIGEQPIKNAEIYTLGSNSDNQTFGFQEAWADYRYKPSRISGEMRSKYPQSLDVWHYGDFYTTLPTLTSEWLQENRVNIDRTIAISSDVADQFICDFYFDLDCVRPLPVNSIPGIGSHF